LELNANRVEQNKMAQAVEQLNRLGKMKTPKALINALTNTAKIIS
jgi:hypothetical protein